MVEGLCFGRCRIIECVLLHATSPSRARRRVVILTLPHRLIMANSLATLPTSLTLPLRSPPVNETFCFMTASPPITLTPCYDTTRTSLVESASCTFTPSSPLLLSYLLSIPRPPHTYTHYLSTMFFYLLRTCAVEFLTHFLLDHTFARPPRLPPFSCVCVFRHKRSGNLCCVVQSSRARAQVLTIHLFRLPFLLVHFMIMPLFFSSSCHSLFFPRHISRVFLAPLLLHYPAYLITTITTQTHALFSSFLFLLIINTSRCSLTTYSSFQDR